MKVKIPVYITRKQSASSYEGLKSSAIAVLSCGLRISVHGLCEGSPYSSINYK
jgi:hypothetical protein